MGETADLILEGILCQQCGVYIDNEQPGYPRTCDSCLEENKPRNKKNMKDKYDNFSKAKDFPRNKKPTTGENAVKGVKTFLTSKKEQNQSEVILAYSKELGLSTNDEVVVCESIQEDFGKFVTWYKKH